MRSGFLAALPPPPPRVIISAWETKTRSTAGVIKFSRLLHKGPVHIELPNSGTQIPVTRFQKF